MSSHPTSMWRRSSNKLRQEDIWLEYFCLFILLLAALSLFLLDLGSLPLTDWDEGIVAQVAKEISQETTNSWHWVFPTLWGQAYVQQPPLVHNLIAIAYKFGGINEWTTRLPGALLAVLSVLLLYKTGREIFVARIPALYSALIYLTLFPVVRQGRMAMSDGPLLCFGILTILAMLRMRRDLRWALVMGLGLGALGLTKGVFMIPLLAISLIFLVWDTPRLLVSPYLWTGICLGIAPLILWYGVQWYETRQTMSVMSALNLFAGSIWTIRPHNYQPIWYYPLILIKFSLPWLIIFIHGVGMAWRNRHWSWSKLVLVWVGCYLGFISLIVNKQPWFILPIYPALALGGGATLDRLRNLPSYMDFPRIWTVFFSLMTTISLVIGLYFGFLNYIDLSLPLICGALTLTFGATAVFIAKKEPQFISLLFWGLYVSLFFFICSSHWIWELKAAYPVKSVAALIRQNVPPNEIVYTSFERLRPALDFYSEHQIIPLEKSELERYWQTSDKSYLLVDRSTVEQLELPQNNLIKDANTRALNWFLAIK